MLAGILTCFILLFFFLLSSSFLSVAYDSTVCYGEYKCYGPGANRTKRVKWSSSLSSDEAAPFLTMDMIGGRDWLRPVPTHFKRGSTIVTEQADGITRD